MKKTPLLHPVITKSPEPVPDEQSYTNKAKLTDILYSFGITEDIDHLHYTKDFKTVLLLLVEKGVIGPDDKPSDFLASS